jgi:hypothetical protein
VQGFLDATGYTFPLLRFASPLQLTYDLTYDNYVVVDPTGIVVYTSQAYSHAPSTGRFFDAEIRAALRDPLVPVAPLTFSAVKGLYR